MKDRHLGQHGVEEKHAFVDLTRVSLLVGLGTGDFTVGHATLKVASNKVVKHEKACFDNQHAFIPFAFYFFGILAPNFVDLLHRFSKGHAWKYYVSYVIEFVLYEN